MPHIDRLDAKSLEGECHKNVEAFFGIVFSVFFYILLSFFGLSNVQSKLLTFKTLLLLSNKIWRAFVQISKRLNIDNASRETPPFTMIIDEWQLVINHTNLTRI